MRVKFAAVQPFPWVARLKYAIHDVPSTMAATGDRPDIGDAFVRTLRSILIFLPFPPSTSHPSNLLICSLYHSSPHSPSHSFPFEFPILLQTSSTALHALNLLIHLHFQFTSYPSNFKRGCRTVVFHSLTGCALTAARGLWFSSCDYAC